MKTLRNLVLAVLLCSSSVAFASGGGGDGEGRLLVFVFLGFGALIIAFQMIPGLILFVSMIKEVFSRPARKSAALAEGVHDRKTKL
jgi:hypothetical protein